MTIATAMPPLSPSGSSEVSVPRILKPGAVRRIRRPGLFDGFLSGQRARVADKLIPAALHSGSILQIGTSDTPGLLGMCGFVHRSGVDPSMADGSERVIDAHRGGAPIKLKHFDPERSERLPFGQLVFEVVVMLSGFHRVPPARMPLLLTEIDRVLKPGGVFVLTTPASWTRPLLRTLNTLRLVGWESPGESVSSSSPGMICAMMAKTPLGKHSLRGGFFEFGLNTWMTVTKSRG